MDPAVSQRGQDGLVCRYANRPSCACDRDVEFDIAAAFARLGAEALPVHLVFAPTHLQCSLEDCIRECLAAAHIYVSFGVGRPQKRGQAKPLVLLVMREVEASTVGE